MDVAFSPQKLWHITALRDFYAFSILPFASIPFIFPWYSGQWCLWRGETLDSFFTFPPSFFWKALLSLDFHLLSLFLDLGHFMN